LHLQWHQLHLRQGEGEAGAEPLRHLLRRRRQRCQRPDEVEDEVEPLQHLLPQQQHQVGVEVEPLGGLEHRPPGKVEAEGEGEA
jgi:hypothetical protein